MPIFNIYDKKKKKHFTELMKWDDLQTLLKENPHYEQVPPDVVNVGDSIRLGIKKPPADFQKYVLGKIKARHPLGNVERKFGNIVREV